eukprot:scaffold25842_cov198-Amphora_coffeaeformis.AAC.16
MLPSLHIFRQSECRKRSFEQALDPPTMNSNLPSPALQADMRASPAPPSSSFVTIVGSSSSSSSSSGTTPMVQHQQHYHHANYAANYAKSLAMADQPKRPLSAYNMFFQIERQRLLLNSQEELEEKQKQQQQQQEQEGGVNKKPAAPYTKAEIERFSRENFKSSAEKAKRPHRKMHGKITFIDLAKTIAAKWKDLDKDEKKIFEDKADEHKRKYAAELEAWLLRQAPSRQIRKRLSALRRGSLAVHLQQHKEEQQQHQQQQQQQEQEQHQQRDTSLVTIPKNPPARRVSDLSEPPHQDQSHHHQHLHAYHPQSPYHHQHYHRHHHHQHHHQASPVTISSCSSPVIPPISPHEFRRKKIQLERARNLNRLYQMQIKLYQEQVRLQEEYEQEQAKAAAAAATRTQHDDKNDMEEENKKEDKEEKKEEEDGCYYNNDDDDDDNNEDDDELDYLAPPQISEDYPCFSMEHPPSLRQEQQQQDATTSCHEEAIMYLNPPSKEEALYHPYDFQLGGLQTTQTEPMPPLLAHHHHHHHHDNGRVTPVPVDPFA